MFVEPSPSARRSRFTLGRSKKTDRPLQLIEQGLELLQAIGQKGFATHAQLARLLFVGRPDSRGIPRSEESAKRPAARSLERLWRSGFMERRRVLLTSKRTGFGYQHFVNTLTRKGAEALQQHVKRHGGEPVRWTSNTPKLSAQTIEHSLENNDFYVSVRRAAEEAGIGLRQWHGDRQLTAMNNRGLLKLLLIPDAFFVLEKDGQFFDHFLEIDTGSMAVAGRKSEHSWIRKILAYGDYFRDHYGQDGFFRGYTAPIVLTVTTSEERRECLLRATKMARGRGVYWYTTRQELQREETFEVNGRVVRLPGASPLWKSIWRVVGESEPRSLKDRLSGTRR